LRGGRKSKSGRVAGTNGYRQNSVKAWQKGSDGWEADFAFPGRLRGGRKSKSGRVAGTNDYRQNSVKA